MGIQLDEARRLHPLTLVQRLIVSLPAMLFILLPLFRGTDDSSIWFNLSLAALYGLFLIPWIAVYYIRFRYWITETEVIIHSGVLTRRRRNIPVDRIQNIDVEQGPLQRMLGTAKVVIYTAGSANAEGVLEYVSLKEAQDIRSIVREIQRGAAPGSVSGSVSGSASEPVLGASVEAKPVPPLFAMDSRRVLLAGAFRFSLLYIAAMFSLLQFVDPDPTVVFDILLRGPLEPVAADIQASPWMAGVSAVLGAVLLGWLTGIALTFNRFHRFTLEREGSKLNRRHGLLTISQGTVPLHRVQSYILRSNPLMQRFGWYRLELQTIGTDTRERGFQVAAPFARGHEVERILDSISVPTGVGAGAGAAAGLGQRWASLEWQPVSPLTTRRFLIRWSVALVLPVAIAAYWWLPVLWGLVLWPLVPVLARKRYANMGWAMTESMVAIRRGIIRKHTWLIPIDKLQTISLKANWFQRRLGLETLYVDTAGASDAIPADLVDVTKDVAEDLFRQAYRRYAAL